MNQFIRKLLSTILVIALIISINITWASENLSITSAKPICQKLTGTSKVSCYRGITRCQKITDKTKQTKCWQDWQKTYKNLSNKKPTRLKPSDSSLLNTTSLTPKCADGTNLQNNKCIEPNISSTCHWGNSSQNITADAYKGITLSNTIGNVFLKNEVIVLKGKTSLSAVPDITAFISNNNDSIISSFVTSNNASGFNVPIAFKNTGNFYLTVIPGLNGSNSAFAITVNDANCNKNLPLETKTASNLRWELVNNQAVFKWNTEANLSRITISQNNQVINQIISQQQNQWIADPVLFTKFTTGQAIFMIETASSSNGFAINRTNSWNNAIYQTINITNHHFAENKKQEISINNLKTSFKLGESISFSGTTLVHTNVKAFVITPTQGVKEVNLVGSGNYTDSLTGANILLPNTSFTFDYKPTTTGTHIIEINANTGLAVLNIPIYESNQAPLIPDYHDLRTFTSLSNPNLDQLKKDFFNYINDDRVKNGVNAVKLDTNISKLAQARADDMVANDYLAHFNNQGLGANDLRSKYGIKSILSENIALDSSSYYAEAGLMRSAGHRANILNNEWTRVGVGIATKNEQFVFVQLFAGEELSVKSTEQLRNEILNSLNQGRTSKLNLDNGLSLASQDWTNTMISDNFLDFINPSTKKNWYDHEQINKLSVAIKVYIASNSSFENLKLNLSQIEDLKSSTYKQIGIGVAQDNQGIIKVTIIYH